MKVDRDLKTALRYLIVMLLLLSVVVAILLKHGETPVRERHGNATFPAKPSSV